LARDSLRNPGLWPYPTMDTLVGGAIMVDRAGRRFLDEGLGGIALSNALARSQDPLAATAVFDQAIWDSAGRTELVPPNPQLVSAGGSLLRAADLATLAAAIEVPAENLQETVAIYNRAVLADAGACTGGIEGGPLGGYVGGFLKAATLGLIAAETIGAAVNATTP